MIPLSAITAEAIRIEKSKQVMDELVALTEEMGLYDEPNPLIKPTSQS
jgi:hypothetical protein